MSWYWRLCTYLLAFTLQLRKILNLEAVVEGCATSHRLKWDPFPPKYVGGIAQHIRKGEGRKGEKDLIVVDKRKCCLMTKASLFSTGKTTLSLGCFILFLQKSTMPYNPYTAAFSLLNFSFVKYNIFSSRYFVFWNAQSLHVV